MATSPVEAEQALASEASWLQEAQCGKLGFSIVTINMVACTVFAANLAIYGALLGAVSLACSAIILPSIALFGVHNYFSYLPKPLLMGLAFAIAWATVDVDPQTGVWKGGRADWAHFYDPRLSQALRAFFTKEEQDQGLDRRLRIMDCGCGMGDYVRDLRSVDFVADGCDGNPDTRTLAGEHCRVVDLSGVQVLRTNDNQPYDWVLSLEVAEHLPPQHEEMFLQNLTLAATQGIVLSWAKKGQGGLGHVNEQNNDYVEQKMRARGWVRDKAAEETLRLQTSPHCFWFRDTIMVFRPLQVQSN